MGDKNSAKFFSLLPKHKILFKKSQVPSVRVAKENALSSLKTEYLQHIGQQITIPQLKKKIQNMRNDVRKKADLRATGNKPIHLKDWERDLLQMMEVESNPVFNKTPGAVDVSFGVEKQKTPDIEDSSCDKAQEQTSTPKQRKVVPKYAKASTAKYKFGDETEETKNLNNQELQRLVLLRQLKLLNLKIGEREERQKDQKKKEEENNLDESIVNEQYEVEMLDSSFEDEI